MISTMKRDVVADPPPSMQDRVRSAIEEAIRTGVIPPGSAINERELAERFQISRTPVREALLMLAAQGLVTIKQRAGIFVRSLSAAEVVAMFETFGEMEAAVARLATMRASAADKKSIAAAHAECGDALAKGDVQAYVVANQRFHEVLYKASANPYLAEQIRQLRLRLSIYSRQQGLISATRMPVSYEEHQAIVDAFAQGDSRAAEAAMRKHIMSDKALADLVLLMQG